MKPFNLEEAINGKAFYLENGYRGVIKYCVDDFITQYEQPPNYPYIGYVLDDKGFLFVGHTAWNEYGKSNEYQSFNATTMVDDTPPQDNKKETMKKFDLKAALNGEPVMLRNGEKAFIKYNLLDELENIEARDAACPLIGYRLYGNYVSTTSWELSGKSIHWATMKYDIVSMWEEPKKQIGIEDLPKPFKPKEDDEYFYINGGIIEYESEFWNSSDFDIKDSKRGGCFRTKEDAQKWLDFMKSMME